MTRPSSTTHKEKKKDTKKKENDTDKEKEKEKVKEKEEKQKTWTTGSLRCPPLRPVGRKTRDGMLECCVGQCTTVRSGELLARAMYGVAHHHGNDTQVAVGSSGARHRGSRADVTVRPQSPLTIVSRRKFRQFVLTSRLSVWLKARLKKAHDCAFAKKKKQRKKDTKNRKKKMKKKKGKEKKKRKKKNKRKKTWNRQGFASSGENLLNRRGFGTKNFDHSKTRQNLEIQVFGSNSQFQSPLVQRSPLFPLSPPSPLSLSPPFEALLSSPGDMDQTHNSATAHCARAVLRRVLRPQDKAERKKIAAGDGKNSEILGGLAEGGMQGGSRGGVRHLEKRTNMPNATLDKASWEGTSSNQLLHHSHPTSSDASWNVPSVPALPKIRMHRNSGDSFTILPKPDRTRDYMMHLQNVCTKIVSFLSEPIHSTPNSSERPATIYFYRHHDHK